jgi:uncharacterized heparinase superfamily protein
MAGAPPDWSLPLLAAGARVRRQAALEWHGSAAAEALRRRLAASGLAGAPRSFRPTDPERGEDLLEGRWMLAGAVLESGLTGDPWDQASPTKRFAEALHRFGWLRDLLATGEPGAAEGARLFEGWERAFGRWSAFSWSGPIMGRRVMELACGARRLTGAMDEAGRRAFLASLLRQADALSAEDGEPAGAAERAAAAAVAASALDGEPAARVAARAVGRLERALDATVLPDGGHRSRSPEAALELLLDLQTLDDLLLQRGREAPKAVARAIDRLGAAVRFFTLGDGRLAVFQGGEAGARAAVAATQTEEDAALRPRPFGFAPHSRYQRLQGARLQLIADAGAPATGAWSTAACAQPLAIDVSADGDRLITNGGWSPEAAGPQAWRLSGAGSTLSLGEGSPGAPVAATVAGVLGPRLVGGARRVDVRRNEVTGGVWLTLSHDGWGPGFGLIHERRLFLDAAADELRGEDQLQPVGGRPTSSAPYAARFHLHPDVRASLARDGRSVLLTGPSERGWWFRNDSADVRLEPSAVFEDGLPRRTVQIVLRGEARGGSGARVRWKLAPAEADVPRLPAPGGML